MKQRAFSSVGGLLGVALITLLLACPMPAHSVSEEIKRWVQNDCRAVSKVIPSLTEAERNKLAHYLFFVLEVPTDMLEMPDLTTAAPTLGGIPAPAPESLPRELLRLKDFSLQRQAQACALHLLPQLSPTSYELLPRLCALMGNYASQQKELQLQAKLLELTSGLALRAANVSKDQDWSKCKISKNGNSEKGRPSASPAKDLQSQADAWQAPPEFFRELINLLSGPSRECAEIILVEFERQVRPFLLDALRKTNPKQHPPILRLLSGIGLDDEYGTNEILALIRSGKPNLRTWALGEIPFQNVDLEQALPAVIKSLTDPEDSVSTEAFKVLDRLRAKAASSQQKPILADSLYEALINELDSEQEHRRGQTLAMLQALTPLPPQVEGLFFKNKPDMEDHTVVTRLIALAGLFPTSPTTINLLLEACDQESTQIKYAAIAALGHLNPSNQLVFNQLIRLIRQGAALKDKKKQARSIYAAAYALNTLGLSSRVRSTLAYILPVLSYPVAWDLQIVNAEPQWKLSDFETGSLFKFLLSTGSGSVPLLLRKVKDPDPLVRTRAAQLLGKLGAFNAASLAVLSDLLKDQSPEVRGAAAQALALAGPAAQPRLSRLLTEKDSHAKKNNPAKTEAAMLLAKIAPDHKGIFEILSNELQRQGCSNKKPLASSLCLLGPVGKTYVQSQFIKCLSSADRSAIPTYLSILTQAAPLTEQSQNALLLLTEGANFPVKAKFKVFEHGPQFGIGSEKLIPILIKSLKEKEAYSITRTLKLLGAFGSEAKAAVPELLRFWQDQEQTSPFRSLAALALLRIDPETIDLNAFFNEELKEDRLESIQEAISAIGADRALPVLTAILESGNLEQQLQTLRCLGRLGQAAASTAPHLLKLHKSTHPKINYEAVLALINIGVSDTAVEERLAQLLLTDDWRRLQRNRNLPANIKPLLEQLRSSDPCSLVRFRSNLLLRRIFHERGHQAS